MFLCIMRLQNLIEEVDEMLNNLPGVTSVHGRFYNLSSKYYRIIGNHAMYYRDALRYLGCVEAKDLPGKYSDCWVFPFDKTLGETTPSRVGPTEIIWNIQVKRCWCSWDCGLMLPLFHNRSRATRKSFHIRPGRPARRGSVQLRRTGKVPVLPVLFIYCNSMLIFQFCFYFDFEVDFSATCLLHWQLLVLLDLCALTACDVYSWCTRSWSRWGTQINSGW